MPASVFTLPKKTSSAIKITTPLPENLNAKTTFHDITVGAAPAEQVSTQSKPANGSSFIPPKRLGLLQVSHERPTEHEVTPAASIDTPESQHSLRSVGETRQSFDSTSSTLDLYAKSYIPIWQTAVNEGPAISLYCSALNAMHFPNYIADFAGRHVLSALETVVLPPLHAIPLRVGHEATNLQPGQYQAYFADALQNEFALKSDELKSLSMYDVSFEADHITPHVYHFTIPGLRESSPRIDLGDIILIRPLVHYPDVKFATQAWYAPQGGKAFGQSAPASSGQQFHAVVWGLHRSREQILLRIDNLPSSLRRCNIIFVIQADRCTSLWRGVQTISRLLNDDANHSAASWLRSMLFPKFDDGVVQTSLPKGQFNLKWFDELLNYEQQKAVDAVITASYGCVPYLISGPPGTGKTKTIVETVLQLLQRDSTNVKPHLLVCAPSDSAADTIASRLSKHLTPLQMFRLHSWTRLSAEVPETLLPYTYMENDFFALPEFMQIMSFGVVVTTSRDADILVQARLTNQALFQMASKTLPAMFPSAPVEAETLIHWTALLLDEAAQSTEPEALIPLSVINPPIVCLETISTLESIKLPQFVMAGDEKQLGPLLSLRSRSALTTSLFARLFARPFYAEHPLARSNGLRPQNASTKLPYPRPAFSNLIRNYRSHPAILTTPSVLFYNDTLVPECTTISDLVRKWQGWRAPYYFPVLFLQRTNKDEVESILAGNGTGAGVLYNPGEADTALKIVKDLLDHFLLLENGTKERLHPKEVAIMSPFRAQVNYLRKVFREANLYQINIGPLEAFQGLESRIMIICTTRTRLGPTREPEKFIKQDQLRGLGIVGEPNRFNVALTRAREGLIVIGDTECLTCSGDENWSAFLGFCKRNACFVKENEEVMVPEKSEHQTGGSAEREGKLEKALKYKAKFLAREDAEANGKIINGSRFLRNNPGRKTGSTMRGVMLSTDEEMWRAGMEMAERDLNPDEEDYESYDSSEEEDTNHADPQMAHSGPEDQDITSVSSIGDFDRDPREEFEKTDCATQ